MAYYFGPILKVAVPGLTDLLKDEYFVVRESAAAALGFIGAAAKAALPALETALANAEPADKEELADAIERIRE